MSKPFTNSTFNSALETGVRSICILSANAEKRFDLQELLAFDHLVVHSGDVQAGPQSLHPNVSKRNGELLVRRRLVESGLLLMESKGMLGKVALKDGIYYQAKELSYVFLERLSSPYIKSLRERSSWAMQMFSDYEGDFFEEVFNVAFSRWTTEFQYAEVSIGS